MKYYLFLAAVITGILSGTAQSKPDQFTVGPYLIDYYGQGDVNYRLQDNVDLYEFFELRKDTTIVVKEVPPTPIRNAFQISAVLGANLHTPKEFGVEGLWKLKLPANMYFNAGVSFMFDYTAQYAPRPKRTVFEFGVPLQIELCNLYRKQPSFYGLFSIAPSFYNTISATAGEESENNDTTKKSGVMIAPSLEVGGNIPLGNVIIRLGVYGKYKINCSTSDYDVYARSVGRAFIGGKLSVII